MTTLLVLGVGVLPTEPGRDHQASGVRAWQLATALGKAGLPVELARLAVGGEKGDAANTPSPAPWMREIRLDQAEDAERAVAGWIAGRRNCGLVGAGTYCSYLLSRSAGELPLWVDLNGDPMAEGQVRAAVLGREEPVLDALWMLAWCVRRGDRFSVVSRAQRHALLGEMGVLGRLNGDSAGHDLVHVLPEAVVEMPPVAPSPDTGAPFTVLFGGSFNSWVDGQTLVEALRIALAAEPTMRFVATGGALPGFLEEPWERFRAALDALPAPSRERVAIPGWVGSDELYSIEDGAGCGVIPELAVAERELGGQNRSLRWMMRGIPVVTTALSDLGAELAARGLALIYPPGDARALADQLLLLARDRGRATELARRARQFVLAERSPEATVGPLVGWARDPQPAPDRRSGAAARIAERLPQLLLDQFHLELGDGER